MVPALAERFWSKVTVRGPDDCWPWQERSQTGNGYGVAWADLGDGPRTHTAHRVAFFLGKGRAPDPDLDVMHSCDNRPCCNPAHLAEGTRLDNMQDCAAKGRTCRKPRLQGDAHPRSKVTSGQVREMRRRALAGEVCWAIAADFGVSTNLVQKAVAGTTWAHVQ